MTADVIPLDATAAVFGQGGALARSFPGYAPRDGQVAMARLVSDVLRDGGGCMVDAPCGTGKSVAYLAPAILRAVKRGERVVVATANIALQEQLVGKDLPALKTTLAPLTGEKEWTFALLKGRSNYVCKSLTEDPSQRAEWESSLSGDELAQLRDVDSWAARTRTGDRSEMPFVVTDSAWRLRSMDREDCHGKACEVYDECFARKAHERAQEASVVVVNYHLLFAHVAMRAETGRDVILPEHHALVMDEAHEAGDIARDFFGHTISEGRMKRLVRWARDARRKMMTAGVECSTEEGAELTEAADALDTASSDFFRCLDDTMAPLLRKTPRVNTARSDQPSCAAALVALRGLAGPLASIRRLSSRIFSRVKRMGAVGESSREALKVQRDAERSGRACAKALGWIEDACRPAGGPVEPGTLDAIHWIHAEERASKHGPRAIRLTWESRHVDLSAVLRAHVWGHVRSVIACSATMTTGAGPVGWGWIRRQLGAPAEARVLSVESPFDFARVAVLCLPSDAPDPTAKTGNRETFDAYVLATLARVAHAAGGRTLGLFTSSRMARSAAEHLRSQSRGFRVLAQGDAPRTQLVAEFKRDETSVLCGTASLWTGVDVPGGACVCVVVDKLPFAPPGDPVMDALQERAVKRTGREMAGFMEESLPRAVLALRQGVGRLIRSTEDWGCVVVCDPRLTTKSYGGDIVRSLGMPTRTRSVTEACAWLAAQVSERSHDARQTREAANA